MNKPFNFQSGMPKLLTLVLTALTGSFLAILFLPYSTTEEKTPKNRLTETLEPLRQNIGAPKLVSRYQIHSLSTLQLLGCCQLTLEAETK